VIYQYFHCFTHKKSNNEPLKKCNILNILLLSLAFCHFNVLAKRPEFIIEIKNHLFYPANITLPANTKIKLIVINYDETPEQFDSFELNREKVIFGGKQAVIYIGPLSTGSYHFFGEYHPDSARGIVNVKNINISIQNRVKNKIEVNNAN